MTEHRSRPSPLERLKRRFDDADLVCPSCEYEDVDGEWSSEANGCEIHYRHECPSCGTIQDRTLSVEDT